MIFGLEPPAAGSPMNSEIRNIFKYLYLLCYI